MQRASQIIDTALKQKMNFLLDYADAVTGMTGVMPRYKIPNPVVHQGPVNVHNVRIDRSVVGAVNTGTVDNLEVSLNDIRIDSDNAELKGMLKEFTEAVLRETNLSTESKNDIMEQLSVIASQMALPKESRLRPVMKGLTTSISAIIAATDLLEHWDKIRHAIGF